MEINVLNGDSMSDELPLGRRIAEILADKNLSRLEFSRRLGWGKDMVYECLDGKRYIKPSELEQMAEKLGMTVRRIRRDDTKSLASELRQLVRSKQGTRRAVNIGTQLLSVAVGWSEKFDVLNDLACAHYYLRQYDESHMLWTEALPYAERIMDKFVDNERLFTITKNLIISYRIQQDYWTLSHLLKKVEPAFIATKPKYAGTVSYAQAVLASNMGKHDVARQKLLESYEHFKATGDNSSIGKSLHNLAYHMFLTKEYTAAKGIFQDAINALSKYPIPRLVSVLDYAKTLLKLHDKQTALKALLAGLETKEIETAPDIKGKFLVLISVLTNDPRHAEIVLSTEGVSEKVRITACQFLLKYYAHHDDAESVLRYYKIVETVNKSSFFEWEEL